jgi:hypothetical protein
MGRQERKPPKTILIVIAILALVWLAMAAFKTGADPTVELTTDLPGIGPLTRVSARAAESGRGLAGLRVEILQGELAEVLFDERYPARLAWSFRGERTPEKAVTAEVGRETHPALEEGEATIRVTAWPAPAWLRQGSPVVEELVLPVRLTPPLLQVVSSQHYVAQGGAEAVVYRVGESSVRDGVEVDGRFFPGYPLPGGGAGDRFALFAVPYDLSDPSIVRLVAADDVGNEFGRTFVDQFFPRPLRTNDIRLSEAFMEKVVPEILSQSPEIRDQGSLLDNYLAINGDLRRQNGETLVELGRRSNPSFAWNEEFLQMPNAQVMSEFAVRRSYRFNGEAVDQQDHLGFDLASVKRAPIPASNSGRVVLARYFGIYGNTVVIDHGYGLQSLYSHLSEFSVSEGDVVQRGQTVGLSGETGLAGGDHLHFTVLLHGMPTNPREWWDEHWITDRLDRKLGDALPFKP